MKLGSKAGSSVTTQMNEAIARINPAQRLLLLTLGLVIVSALIGVFAIQIPWMEQRDQIESRTVQEQQRLEILREIQRIQSRLGGSEKELLLTGGAPALTSYVSTLASQWGIRVDSVAPQGEIAVGPYANVQLEITATASLESLLNFLHALENHRPFLALDLLEIGQTAAPGARGGASQQNLFEPDLVQPVRLRISALTRQGAS